MNAKIERRHKISIENPNQNEAVSFSVATVRKGDYEMVELTLIPNNELIHKTLDKSKILYPPSSIVLELDEESLLTLTSCLISSISIPFSKENIETLGSKFEVSSFRVEMLKNRNEESRNKIIFNIFRNDEQIICFTMNKTKITLLLFLLKDTFKKIKSPCQFLVENKSYLFRVFKDDKNEFAINRFLLRNTEIEILRYIIYTLIFDYKYRVKLDNYKKIYRQILVFENKQSEFVVFIKDANQKKTNFYFTINSQILAALMLAIPELDIFKGLVK
ncbi:hypothetical protein ACOTWR_06305 [Aliarcobacter butzleri]|uniref:hypothetical protein n=1 Tax=Aliarcobacter butzleri TaxID=28197 RepID=UPI0021B4554D|nr:hypothetical protein [Aliarcobacter butzleri]MCT7578663.1 hypothetical protein [Aliarcobacter butzleri]MCT7647605.1 hypothetical protein [Aliarcobacter butzleri]